MGDDYHTNYNELISIEKTLNGQITELQKCVEGKTNSTKLEMKIKDNILAHQKKREALNALHEKTGPNLPAKEEEKRRKNINTAKLNLDRIKMTFESLTKRKYEYKIDDAKYENYQLDEQGKNMTNTELLEYQQRKIKDQDQEIEEITGEVKKGKEMGKVIKTNLENQNKLLDDVETGMDNLDSKMTRTKKKFNNYVTNSSSCCLTIVIILEIGAMAFMLYYIMTGN